MFILSSYVLQAINTSMSLYDSPAFFFFQSKGLKYYPIPVISETVLKVLKTWIRGIKMLCLHRAFIQAEDILKHNPVITSSMDLY